MSGFLGNLHKKVTNPQEGGTGAYISVATGDVAAWAPDAPIIVVRWGFIATTTVNDVTNALKLTLDLRPTVGSDAARVTGATATVAATQGYNASNQPALFADTAGGSLTLVASASQVAAGKGVFHDMNPQAASGTPPLYPPYTTQQPESTQLEVYPGQELRMKSQATAPAAGAGVFFIEALERPVQYDRLSQYSTIITGPVPSNPFANMVKFFS